MSEIVYATWCLSDNFGDKLTPYLVEKLSGKKCVYVDGQEDVTKYMVCGSILNWDACHCYVWGAGIANRLDTIPAKNGIYATRGVISNAAAKSQGINTWDICGDPALLLPYLYNPKKHKKYKVSIIPHYIDYYTVKCLFDASDVNIINIMGDIETVINEICASEFILTSSLHGLIVADAYGIPNKWAKFSNKILGDDTKYYDYYSTTDKMGENHIDLRGVKNADLSTIDYSVKSASIEELKKLLNVCPFNDNKITI